MIDNKFIECCHKDPDVKQFAIFTEESLLATKGEKGRELYEAFLAILVLAFNIGDQFQAEQLLVAKFVSKKDQYSFRELGFMKKEDSSESTVYGVFYATSSVDLDNLILSHQQDSKTQNKDKKRGKGLIYRGVKIE